MIDGSPAIILSVCASLCVLAVACSAYSALLSDPARIRRALALVRAESDELRTLADAIRTVEFPRMEATCEAILERAEDRFDAAERKRKSVSGGRQRNGGEHPLLQSQQILADEGQPRADRKRALAALMRGE